MLNNNLIFIQANKSTGQILYVKQQQNQIQLQETHA